VEILRALAALIEPPSPALIPVAEALDLGVLPAAEVHTDLLAFQLYPFASVFLNADGMLGGESRDRVGGFWRALGAEVPAEPDHLAILLAGYASLHEQEADASGDARSRARHTRTAFLAEHLLSWLPAWLGTLERLSAGRADRTFYRAWGSLLGRVIEEDRQAAPATLSVPLHLRVAPALSDPREEGAEAFLRGILAPAVSGLILVRDDLARCARESDLGLRVGERAFVLRSLLSQEPATVLRWLATEAHRQTPPAEAEGVATEHWRIRGVATSRLLGVLAEEAADHDRSA
jgi:hypothetical protein